MADEETTVNKARVKEMGFTEKMIEELLPEPDEKPNPWYACAAPQKIWQLSDVKEAMRTERYAEMREQYEKRKAAAQKAVITKRAKTKEAFDALIGKITVKTVPMGRLRKETILEKRLWNELHGRGCDDDPADAPEHVIERWMVNYVRHVYTNYDRALYQGKGAVGIREEYRRYKREVLDRIAEAYPQLADECDMQANMSVVERQMFEDYIRRTRADGMAADPEPDGPQG